MNYIAFKKFLASSGLSTRRFADLAGIGKTTVHRLAQPGHGGLTSSYIRSIIPALMRTCRGHLTASRAGADDIHLILTDIFEDAYIPALIQRYRLTSEMLAFFGLARDPFAAPRRASEVFLTEEMTRIRSILVDSVRFQGFTALIAPVGTGKTVIKDLLLRLAAGNTPTSQMRAAATGAQASLPALNAQRSDSGTLIDANSDALPIRNPTVLSPTFPDMSRVTAAGIVHYTLEAFHIKPRRSLVLAARQLEDLLAGLDRPVALCFDECHRLSDATLTALKNFYELGTGGFERFLGLILFGQPQFRERLAWPRFREIAERLNVVELPPFSPADTENFLNHCLANAAALPSGPITSGPIPAPGAFAAQGEGAPTFSVRRRAVRGPGVSAGLTPDVDATLRRPSVSAGLTPDTDAPVRGNPHASKGASPTPDSTPASDIGPDTLDPPSQTLNFEHETLNYPFSADAVAAIASRAATPLAIANLASAAMIEAYRKGERHVTARFIPEDGGPCTARI